MGKLKIELNDTQNIRDLLQNAYNLADEQIVQAAEKYVQGFNGDYQYMKLLKYFILKEKVGAGGDVEGESDLINYIENAGQEDTLSNDWTSTLK